MSIMEKYLIINHLHKHTHFASAKPNSRAKATKRVCFSSAQEKLY